MQRTYYTKSILCSGHTTAPCEDSQLGAYALINIIVPFWLDYECWHIDFDLEDQHVNLCFADKSTVKWRLDELDSS